MLTKFFLLSVFAFYQINAGCDPGCDNLNGYYCNLVENKCENGYYKIEKGLRDLLAGGEDDDDDYTECLSENDLVLLRNGELARLGDILIGDYIFDGDEFTKVLTVEYHPQQTMLKLFMSKINDLSDETTVTMTANHLLYDNNNELIPANTLKIGSLIYDNFIVNKIENDKQHSSTPITFSGYLQVNGIKTSSYIRNKKHALLAHSFFGVFRWLSDNINEQITGKIAEWIVYDHHYYYSIIGEKWWENSVNFYFAAPCVSAIIVGTRLLFPIISCIVIISITSTLIIKKKKN